MYSFSKLHLFLNTTIFLTKSNKPMNTNSPKQAIVRYHRGLIKKIRKEIAFYYKCKVHLTP